MKNKDQCALRRCFFVLFRLQTHHNDTALVRQLRDAGRIIEPLKDLHKLRVNEISFEIGSYVVWFECDLVWFDFVWFRLVWFSVRVAEGAQVAR